MDQVELEERPPVPIPRTALGEARSEGRGPCHCLPELGFAAEEQVTQHLLTGIREGALGTLLECVGRVSERSAECRVLGERDAHREPGGGDAIVHLGLVSEHQQGHQVTAWLRIGRLVDHPLQVHAIRPGFAVDVRRRRSLIAGHIAEVAQGSMCAGDIPAAPA